MNRIVKVISFPGNFSQDRYNGSILNLDKREPILLEAEDGSVRKLPAISCANELEVGRWYEMYLISATLFPRYGFHYLKDRNDPPLPESVPPRTRTLPVTVVEQPSEENDDEFTVRQDNGTTRKIHLSSVRQYLTVGTQALLTIRVLGSHESYESLELPKGKRSRYPTKPGTVKEENRRVTVSNGYRWVSVRQAIDEDLLDPSAVGTLVKSAKICSGAIGGPSEYTIFVHVWKVGLEYVLDEREDGGGFEVVTSLKAAAERIRGRRDGTIV